MKTMFNIMAAALLMAGCDKLPTTAENEANERTGRLYSNAMDDLKAGRLDAAIKGFKKVITDEPRAHSAHFQLATLLQDSKKDYLEAIVHYRMYMALRPSADKATVAQERMRLCMKLFEAETIKRNAGDSSVIKEDNEKLTAERNDAEKQIAELKKQLAAAEKQIETLKQEAESRSKLISKLSDADDGRKNSKMKNALEELKALEANNKKRHINPTDEDLLDEDDGETPVDDRIKNSDDLKKLRASLDKEEQEDKDSPFAKALFKKNEKANPKPVAKNEVPETYTIEPNDTLFKISTKFYGSSKMWQKIRDLNKAEISPDGRVRAGKVIKLPRPEKEEKKFR